MPWQSMAARRAAVPSSIRGMDGHSVDPASAPNPQVNEQDVLLVCGLLVMGIGSKSHVTYAPCTR